MRIVRLIFLMGVLAAPLSGCDQLLNVANATMTQSASPTESEVIAGIKQALTIGIQNGATKLGGVNGYFGNAAYKILMPAEAQNVENKLRELGMNSLMDNAILSMNRAAENAATKSIPIFTQAITNMSITDAMGILKGGPNAATEYLKRTTIASLKSSFKPEIQAALDANNATKYWSEIFNTYNKIPFVSKVNTDLSDYVTGKAIEGLFSEVAAEEAKIRTNPQAQVSDILKKVFGSK